MTCCYEIFSKSYYTKALISNPFKMPINSSFRGFNKQGYQCSSEYILQVIYSWNLTFSYILQQIFCINKWPIMLGYQDVSFFEVLYFKLALFDTVDWLYIKLGPDIVMFFICLLKIALIKYETTCTNIKIL